jgi:hypothetical protein
MDDAPSACDVGKSYGVKRVITFRRLFNLRCRDDNLARLSRPGNS